MGREDARADDGEEDLGNRYTSYIVFEAETEDESNVDREDGDRRSTKIEK